MRGKMKRRKNTACVFLHVDRVEMLQRLSSTLCPLPRHLPRLPRSHAVHTALPSFNRSSSSSKRKSSASDNDSTMSSAKTKTPFGAFPSPISSNVVLSSSISLVDVLVTSDGTIVWVEGRPMEEGRNAIVAQSADGAHVEIIPNENGLNARTQIHEYGGASVGTVMNDVIFSEIHGPVFKAERSAEGVWTKAKQITPSKLIATRPLFPLLLLVPSYQANPSLASFFHSQRRPSIRRLWSSSNDSNFGREYS